MYNTYYELWICEWDSNKKFLIQLYFLSLYANGATNDNKMILFLGFWQPCYILHRFCHFIGMFQQLLYKR